MSESWPTIAIPFNQGVDTKSDAKALQPPKLAVLENGEFTERGSLRKRRGGRSLGKALIDNGSFLTGDLSFGRALLARGDELLVRSDGGLHSYSEPHDGWPSRGNMDSIVVDQAVAFKVPAQQTLADYGEVDGVGVYAWEDSRGGVRVAVVDAETGAIMAPDYQISTTGTRPRVVVIAGWLHVLYLAPGTTAIRTQPISPANVWPSLQAGGKDVVTDAHATMSFDVVAYGARAVLAYYTSTVAQMKVGFVDGAGALVGIPAPVTLAATVSYALALGVDNVLGDIVVLWSDTTDVRWAVLGPDLATLQAPASLVTAAIVSNIAISFFLPTATRHWAAAVYYETEAASTWNYVVQQRLITRSLASVFGNVAFNGTARHAALASRAFAEGAASYVHIVHDSPLQSTFFTMGADESIVAKILPGTAGGITAKRGHLPSVVRRSGDAFRWAGIYKRRLDSASSGVFTEKGLERIDLRFSDERSFRRAQLGQTLYIAGGVLHQYDGHTVVESGFHLFTENVTGASEANGGGTGLNPAAGTGQKFSYAVYPEWTNAQGEREQGTMAALVTVTVTNVAHNAIRLTIPTIWATLKKSIHAGSSNDVRSRADLDFAVYRTEVDPASTTSPRYRVSSLDPTAVDPNGYRANDSTVDTVVFIDKMTDAALVAKERDYQNSSPLDHVAPPAAAVLAAGKDRVFLAGGDEGNRIYPSKVRAPSEALAFADALVFDCDSVGGPITAMAVMNELLIIFKKRSIFALAGDGPNNLGGGAWGRPQLITGDTGCDNPRSVVMVPGGLMFQSEKGKYLLTQSLGLEYVGADVEAFNADRVNAAILVADRNQVLFVGDERTMVYDYLFKQWAVWTFGGVDATVWKDSFAYLRLDGSVRVETANYFKDGGTQYRLKLETAWIKPDALQRRWRVRRALLLGDYRSAHKLQIDIAFDYGAFTHRRTFDPATGLSQVVYGGDAFYGAEPVYGGAGDTVYQCRLRMPRQKCSAVKFAFQDIPSADPGESYELTELALEVKPLQGLAKLPAGKTLG